MKKRSAFASNTRREEVPGVARDARRVDFSALPPARVSGSGALVARISLRSQSGLRPLRPMQRRPSTAGGCHCLPSGIPSPCVVT